MSALPILQNLKWGELCMVVVYAAMHIGLMGGWALVDGWATAFGKGSITSLMVRFEPLVLERLSASLSFLHVHSGGVDVIESQASCCTRR
jgi:hypothetical protein